MVALSEMNTITHIRVFSVATVPTYDQLGMITGIYTYSTVHQHLGKFRMVCRDEYYCTVQ